MHRLVLLSFLFLTAVLAKKERSTKPPPTFADLDFQKRPLNFYIVANGKHALVQNVTDDRQNLLYREVTPPFSIKQRADVLVLSHPTPSIQLHQGYPSFLQMLAASGHHVVAVDVPDDTPLPVPLTRPVVLLLGPTQRPLPKDISALIVFSPSTDFLQKIVPEGTRILVVSPSKPLSSLLQVNHIESSVSPFTDKDASMQILANFLDFLNPRG